MQQKNPGAVVSAIRPPEPMIRRRMLRHNAIEAWQTMQKTGWRAFCEDDLLKTYLLLS